MSRANLNSPGLKPWHWALLAVGIDVLILVALLMLGGVTPFQGAPVAGLWVTAHEPALTIAAFLAPGPPGAHAPLPVVSYLIFGLLALAEAGALGAALGWVYTASRRRRAV